MFALDYWGTAFRNFGRIYFIHLRVSASPKENFQDSRTINTSEHLPYVCVIYESISSYYVVMYSHNSANGREGGAAGLEPSLI
jgi:hypothetical protein